MSLTCGYAVYRRWQMLATDGHFADCLRTDCGPAQDHQWRYFGEMSTVSALDRAPLAQPGISASGSTKNAIQDYDKAIAARLSGFAEGRVVPLGRTGPEDPANHLWGRLGPNPREPTTVPKRCSTGNEAIRIGRCAVGGHGRGGCFRRCRVAGHTPGRR